MREGRSNITFYLACLLLVLVIITTRMTGGLYARYKSVATGGDSARVARFLITTNNTEFSSDLALRIAPSEDGYASSYEIYVRNDSEVSVICNVVVTNSTGNLPLVFSYDDGIRLMPNENGVIKINVSWSVDGALDYIGMVDLVKFKVNVSQLD